MNLDMKDQRILRELDLNPRIPTSRIAKAIRLSQQVTDYRLKRLQSEGVILAIPTIINPARLGLAKYHLFFQLSTAADDARQKVIESISKQPCVSSVAATGGKWDIWASVLVTSYEQFEAFLDAVFADNTGIVRDYEAIYTVREEHHSLNHLQEKPVEATISVNYAEPPVEIDKVDSKILQYTASDCRIPCLEVGRRVGISYKTVQSRVKRMEATGIIAGYRVIPNIEKYGYQRHLLVLSFNNYGRLAERKMQAHARSSNAVLSSAKLFGRWSVLFELTCKDAKELQEFVVQLRTTYPIIGSYEVIPVFGTVRTNWLPDACVSSRKNVIQETK